MTPSSSSSLSILRIPLVATTAAFLGFLPVANALGIDTSLIPTSGMGRPASLATFSTML